MTTHCLNKSAAFLAAAALLAIFGFAVPAGHAATNRATWTTGHKKVLVIPIRYTDVPGPSDVPSPSGHRSGWGDMTNGTTAAALNDFFQRQSYGKTSLEFTVLPEIDMGVSYLVYTNRLYPGVPVSKFGLWDEPGSIADDVRAKARLAGQAAGQPALYDSDNYDLDIIISGFVPGQGVAASGRSFGKGIMGTTTLALAHEICHNFGCQHANGISRATFYSPLTNGSFFIDTYGDVYDLMGWKNTAPVPLVPDRDANPFWKHLMGWLADSHITTTATSGLYRVFAFDQPVLEAGKNYALRVARDPNRTYWFSYRQSITNAESIWSQNGLEVRIGGESIPTSTGHTTLLDMTPGSRGLPTSTGFTNNPYATLYDAPLALGRTYTDAEAGLHVTPVQKGGTTPQSLDVVVNLGSFPGNSAPSVTLAPLNLTLGAGVSQIFTATASDSDGDALAYYWEFDDPDALGGNAAGNTHPDARLSTQGSHTWTRNGDHLIRCTVTDMKGRTTTASTKVTITNGTAARLTISGVVRDELGNPLAGAVVNNYKGNNPNLVRYGATNFVASSATAADGKYVIYVPTNGTSTYHLNVLFQGFSFTPSVANGAVTVAAASVANINFNRLRTNRTLSGYVNVAGRNYDPAVDGALTVHVGTQSVAAIKANIVDPPLITTPSWTLSVTDGAPVSVTATPANPAHSVSNYAPDPYLVVNDFHLMQFYLNIPGRMPEVGFTSAGATSDDTAGTVNIPVTMTLPPGSNTWPANQFVYCWIDHGSTAEYGVDYKLAAGSLSFFGGQVPVPKVLPLQILPTGVPGSRTVVLKLGMASSIVNLGPITTFTYTITNPAPVATISRLGDGIQLAWPGVAAGRYTIESSPGLNPPVWSAVPPHTNLPGTPGLMLRTVPISAAASEFFRIKVE
jgi:hypothetical protein